MRLPGKCEGLRGLGNGDKKSLSICGSAAVWGVGKSDLNLFAMDVRVEGRERHRVPKNL